LPGDWRSRLSLCKTILGPTGDAELKVDDLDTLFAIEAQAMLKARALLGIDADDSASEPEEQDPEEQITLLEARALLGIDADDSASEAEEQDPVEEDDDLFAAKLAEARALLGIDADYSASEAEDQDDDVDADAAYEAALAEARVLFELDDDLFAAKLTDDESHEVAVENGDGARKVPVRVAWADLEDSPSEYDEEWEQVHARDWAKVATTSHLPAAKAADPPEQSRCPATRRTQRPRRRRRAGAQPAS
ncbi:unnamed protein product, partial [Prorocentrum cordatum]